MTRTVRVGAHDLPLDPRVPLAAIGRDVREAPRPIRVWMAVCAVLVAIGTLAAVTSIPPGSEVFGTTAPVDWGALIAHYVFLVTTTSGLCLVSALGHVFGVEAFRPIGRRAAVLATCFLVAGFVVIAIDLHYPIRLLMGVVLSPSPQSAMWWMGVVYGIYLVFLVIELFGMFWPNERIARIGGALTVAAAVVAPTTLGAVFAFLISRPAWHDPGTPLMMLITAIISGTAVLGLSLSLGQRLRLRGHGPEMERLIGAVGVMLAVCCVAALYLVVSRVLTGLYGSVPLLADAIVIQLTGPLAILFWPKLVLGLAVPLWLLARSRSSHNVMWASGLAFFGMFLDRMAFVLAGQMAPTSTAAGIIADPWFAYLPSLVELGVTFGALGLVGLAYALAELTIDLSERPHPVAAAMAAAEVGEGPDAPLGSGPAAAASAS